MADPLDSFERVHSSDLDEARACVGEVFTPHHLSIAEGNTNPDIRFRYAGCGSVGLSFLRYGARVHIREQHLSTFFVVQIPLSGSALIRTGSHEVHSDVRIASVPQLDADLDMTWEADNAQLMVRLERSAVETQLRLLLGREPTTPLSLTPSMDLTDPGIQSWLSTVHTLRQDLEGPNTVSNSHLSAQLQQLLISQLLLVHPHSSSSELRDTVPSAPPRIIRRAEQLIIDHAREPLTVADIAEAVGVSVRALQEGFRRHLDTTPTACLREARLVGVRAELAAAQVGEESVSTVATRWGFWHLGRFAGVYRQRWGESPSETLRR